MIVHGPMPARSIEPLACCGRHLDDLVGASLVTSDPDATTCEGPWQRQLAPFAEVFDGPALQYGTRHGDLLALSEEPHLVRLEGGELDIGILRTSVAYGDRWRPWKRHLRHAPRWLRRLAGWKPSASPGLGALL